ncbi:MAG TPA: PLP-dependent aminotransferase family protein [Actinopolymorphaceae bacterium]|nr:PLP-dependent aminotransferase family protein [Actinopolymorphaceae bacterium]
MATVRAKLGWDTLLDVEGAGPGPLHDRLTRALRQAIRDGRLAADSALPPSRALALDLGCSRWVVTQAYAQLVAEGYLSARTGSATTVREIAPGTEPTPSAAAPPATVSADPRPAPRFDLAPGLPDLREFPRRRWTESVRTQLSTMPYTDLGYPPPGGVLRLREVMADYLRRVRGAVAASDDVTCCLSVSEGVARLAARLRAAGITRIAVEDPGWTRLRQTLERVGVETVGVGVDAKGLRTSELAAHHDVRAVLVTPAHQFPTGVVLAPERRAALLAWARDVDGLVLEDDYDAEFRYDRRPVGTLQGTDPAHVALFGSLSKTLSPALGLGWMVTPPRWTEALRAHESGMVMPPALNQLAFAEFVESGGYDRHLRAARQRYRHRRDALVAAIAAKLPDCTFTGIAAGLHLVLGLEPSTAAAAVLDRAAAEGVKVADLDTYRLSPDPSAPALVLGYGNLPDGAVVPAVSRLAAAVAAVRTAGGRAAG